MRHLAGVCDAVEITAEPLRAVGVAGELVVAAGECCGRSRNSLVPSAKVYSTE